METIFKIRTGSHLYGLNDENSDEDFFSVFIPDSDQFLGLDFVDEVDNSTKGSGSRRKNNSDDRDDKAMALHKYIKLLLQNNPNIVETLFPTKESLVETSANYQLLMDLHESVISQRVYYSFSGYAYAQCQKMIVKRERYHGLKEAVSYLLNMIENYLISSSASETLKEDHVRYLNTVVKHYKGSKGNVESFHVGMPFYDVYRLLKEELDSYGWRVLTKSFEELGYDVKFAYHLVRLMYECYDLLTTGVLHFPFTGERKETLMKIKHGEVTYEDIMKLYDELEEVNKRAFEKTKLPKNPNRKTLNKFVVYIMEEKIYSTIKNRKEEETKKYRKDFANYRAFQDGVTGI